MRKINRAPETRTPGDLHYTYSRSEMRRETRYVSGRRPSTRSWNVQKILLFDLLFLFIIGGVIVPFVINRNLSGKIDVLSFKMELRRQNDTDVFVSIHIRNTGRDSASNGPIEIEIKPGDFAPQFFTELPPEPGEGRIIRYKLEGIKEPFSISCSILWEDHPILLNGKV